MTVVLVTGAGGSAGANVIDALRRSGRPYRVIGTDASPVRLHLSAADVRMVTPLPSAPDYAESMAAVMRAHDVEFVQPQPDGEVLAVSALRDTLPARTFLPDHSALETAADKQAFAAAMTAGGVPVPESKGVADFDELTATVAEMMTRHARLWVRARRGAGSRAALPVRRPDQAVAWARWWVEERGLAADDFMVAQFLPGREFAYQSVWQGGELVAGQARERVEYLYGHFTPSGQSSTPAVARTVCEAAVDETACAAVRALEARPNGVFCVDLKEDADGMARVTEVNAGRFFTTSNFFAAAGLNMPDMAVRCALGEELPRLGSSPLPPGLYWIRMVDMGYKLVPADELDPWPRPGR